MADTVLIATRDGTITYVNPAFEAVTGFAREEAIGRSPSLMRSGIQTSRFYETLWSTIEAGRVFHTTLTNRTRDGRLYEHEQTVTPIVDASGAITHYAAVGRDVTDRRRDNTARTEYQLEREALRVAALLHDEAGQYLALAHIALADLTRNLGASDLSRLYEVRSYLDCIEERLREASRGVQPHTTSESDVLDAITFLASGCERRSRIPVTVEAMLDVPCPAVVASVLYAVVRDALRNVSIHAHATRVHLVLAREVGGRRTHDNTITCSIRDDGDGFDVAACARHGVGSLNRLRQRLNALGGRLEIVSAAGMGTEIRATVPVEA
jgi:PAS domain S-box-containing protein